MNPYDPDRNIWIVDDWASQVFKFTNDGSKLVMTLGEREVIGDGPDHFGRPTDMAFFPDGTFLVSDGYVNARVVKFSAEGECLMEWGRSGTGPDEFNLVHSVKLDADRRVYVADRRNGRIQIFDEFGTLLDMWEGMAQPSHLLVTQDQTVWMSDPTLNRLLQYNLSGMLLTYWGTAGSFPGCVQQPSPLRRGSGGEPLRGGLCELPRAEVGAEGGRGSEAPDPARLRIHAGRGAVKAGGEYFRRARLRARSRQPETRGAEMGTIVKKCAVALALGLVMGGAGSVIRPSPASAQDPGWTTLFDGSSLDRWNVIGGANWTLDENEGSVAADMGEEGHLVSESSYGDFELVVEFWAEPATNSGVYIRCSDPADITAQKCYEVNISDVRPDPTYRTGAVVGVSSPLEHVDAGDRWNEYVIRADGPRLTVTLNGIRTVDAEDGTHSAGVIGLQYSAGLIKFRSVRIRPL